MIGAGVVLIAVAIVLLAINGSAGSGGPPRLGATLANFSLTDLSGKTVQLSDFTGRPVLINAWATWCPPCQEEMPDLNAYYQQYRSQGFVVLAVNAGETAAQASAYAQQYGLTFPVLLDPQENLMDLLHINDFPTSILVGRDGKVKVVYIGLMSRATIDAQLTPYLN
jgi:peroxiredoxin